MQQLLQQALAAQQRRDFQQAESIYQQLLQQTDGHPAIEAHYAALLCQTRRAREALPYLKRAIDGLPDEQTVLQQGIQIASQLGEHQLALDWLRRLISRVGEQGPLLEQLAGIQIACHEEEEALKTLKKLLKLMPKNANAQNLKGLALCRLGDTEKGYKCFQKSVQANPGNLGALRNLLTYGKGRKEPLLDQVMPQLQKHLNQPGLDAQSKMNIGYILALYFDKKQPAESFAYLSMANSLNRQQYTYQHAATQRMFENLMDAFDASFIDAAKTLALDSPAPIFILGMPRSGTTLIEQILSSHSKVEAQGEIEDLRKSFEKEGDGLFPPKHIDERVAAGRRVCQSYLDAVSERHSAPHFTDKMPYNFMLIGLIASLMPNAKIIHCTRDPIETCFSIYKQNFSGSHAYSNDLEELGQYFNAYQSLMAVWQQRFPGCIYTVNYEALIQSPDSEISNLLHFCGLDTEPACLAFYKNKRAVRTASVAQVRQPLYKDAMKASAPYITQLEPLRAVLDSKAGGALRAGEK